MRVWFAFGVAVGVLFAGGCIDAGTLPPGDPVRVSGTSAAVGVSEGVYAPPQVKREQDFQVGVVLRNTGSSTVQYEEVALAVLRPEGTHAYDAARWTRVNVSAGGRWDGSRITHLQAGANLGTHAVVARGRLAGGTWFDFPTAGGKNPATVTAVSTPAFGAVIERIQMDPGMVTTGTHPRITAVIRNTSSLDTQWDGHATFIVRARVRRGDNVLHQQEWSSEPFHAGETRVGFSLSTDFSTGPTGAYEVIYEVWSGDGAHRFAVRHDRFWAVNGATHAACPVPPEARHPVSYTAFWRSPYRFRAATPWLAAVHDTLQSGSSYVDVDYIRLWARIGGVARIVSANEYDGEGGMGGELDTRDPWFEGVLEAMPATLINGVMRIRPSQRPDRVWHPVLVQNPREDIFSADSVWMEIRLLVSGPALVQGGLDYWRKRDDTPHNGRNEEAGVTDWICARTGWQTLKLERSTEVRNPITITTAPVGSPPRVGSPVQTTFVIRNFDNDTIRLAEVGVEIRRVEASNLTCDWAENPLAGDPTGRWAENLVLAPGATHTHTMSWTPSRSGTHCLTIVERRAWAPCNAEMSNCYQKTFFRARRQIVEVAP